VEPQELQIVIGFQIDEIAIVDVGSDGLGVAQVARPQNTLPSALDLKGVGRDAGACGTGMGRKRKAPISNPSSVKQRKVTSPGSTLAGTRQAFQQRDSISCLVRAMGVDRIPRRPRTRKAE